MAEILDGISGGLILDGLADWPASTTRKEWFRLTRELVQKTIADMDLDPAALIGIFVWADSDQRQTIELVKLLVPGMFDVHIHDQPAAG